MANGDDDLRLGRTFSGARLLREPTDPDSIRRTVPASPVSPRLSETATARELTALGARVLAETQQAQSGGASLDFKKSHDGGGGGGDGFSFPSLGDVGEFIRKAAIHTGDFGAGFLGQTTPSQMLAEREQRAEGLRLKRIIQVQGLVSDAIEQRGKIPLGAVDEFDKAQKERFAQIGEAFGVPIDYGALAKSGAIPDNVMDVPEVRAMAASGALTMNNLADFLTSKDGIAAMSRHVDSQVVPTLRTKLDPILREARRNDPGLFENGFRFTEFQALNRTLPEDKKLSEREMRSLERNLEKFNDVFETADVAESRQRTEATREAKAGEAAERARQAEARITLKLLEGGEITEQDRAFLTERQRLSPINRIIQGAVGDMTGDTGRAATDEDVNRIAEELRQLGQEPTPANIRSRAEAEGLTF